MNNRPVYLLFSGLLISFLLILFIPFPTQNIYLAYDVPQFKCKYYCEAIFGYTALGESVIHSIFWGSLNTIITALSARLMAVFFSVFFILIVLITSSKLRNLYYTISDTIITIPAILFAVTLLFITQGSVIATILAIGITEWAFNLKWLLSRTIDYQNKIYIQSAELIGAGKLHLFVYHYSIEVSRDVKRLFKIYLPETFLGVAALEFLGLSGAPILPGDGLGYQIVANKELIFLKPHTILFPVFSLLLLMFFLYYILNRFKNN